MSVSSRPSRLSQRPLPQRSEIQRAIEFAARAHRGQLRKDSNVPYVVHPIEVLKRLSDLGVRDAATLAAAALHDVVEDTPVELAEIAAAFGAEVAGLVDELSFDPSREGKVEYLEAFAQRSPQALAIKLTDRACNVDDYRRWRPDYAAQYARKAVTVYAAVEHRRDELGGAFGRETARRLVGLAQSLTALANGADPGSSAE